MGSPALATPRDGDIRGAGAEGAIKDSYIVVMKDGAALPGQVGASAVGGGTVEEIYDSVNGYATTMSEAQAKKVAGRSDVAYVEQNRVVKMSATQPSAQWDLDRIDQQSRPLNGSYTYPNTASTVRAYVIDSGIRTTHSQFGGRATAGADFIDGTPTANDDCEGHGTHVAGTIGGSTYGVAKGVALVSVRVLDCEGAGTLSGVLSGVQWVTANAVKPAVVNMSLGTNTVSTTLDDAVRASIASGLTYTLAAGNDTMNACLSSPSDVTEGIVVGASDAADWAAYFSNFGQCLDLFAPGVDIRSAGIAGDSATMNMDGTSMAAPHVAGAAAMLLAANPSLTPAQVQTALVNAAVPNKIRDAGPGSPTGLLQVSGATPAAAQPFTLMARANGRWVTAENGGNSALVARGVTVGLWEQFDVADAGNGTVSLKSRANNKYLTAENAGNSALIANRTAVGSWEKFKLVTQGDGGIAIQAMANNKFVTAENGGNGPLIANRTAVGAWEKFDQPVDPALISLTAAVNNRVVTAENGGYGNLVANRTAVGAWEEFDMLDAGDGWVALRSHANGRFVSADNAGKNPLVANRTSIGAWEKFRVIHMGGTAVALLANANLKFVTAENAGNGGLVARADEPGSWEVFYRSVV
ncbi:S8 family serine peptidase [Virgisporangium aliadipatigenens]|nr:S8 family serine peptidase [Virgisporangium aliadipatigenens]